MQNHSNRQPIGNYLIVFLDSLPNIKIPNQPSMGAWKYKESDVLLGADNKTREEMAYRATSGILLAMGGKCFADVAESEKPKIGDRLSFTSYSGLHKIEGDLMYRSLKDSEVHDWYIPQRNEIKNSKKK
jgi:hypothetical protein